MSDSTTTLPTGTAATASANLNLAPDTSTTPDSLTNSFNSFNLMTGYALALQTANISPVPGDNSSWFPTFEQNLQTAQAHAQVWTNTLGPAISTTIPQSIITYNDTFTNVTNDILAIVNACMANLATDGTPQITTTQITELQNYFQALNSSISPIQSNITSIQSQLNTYISNVESDYTNLVSGQTNAQQEINLDEQTITQLNGDINTLQANVAAMNKLATASEIGMGVGIFMAIVGIGLAVVSGGAAAPLVVAGIAGVSMAGAGIGGTVACTEQISDDQQQITQDQQTLTDDQKQVTALQGITNSLSYLISYNSEVQTAVENVLISWQTLSQKLNAVVTALQNAYTAESDIVNETVPANNFLDLINEQVDIQTAQTAWSNLSTFAENMLECYTNTQIQIQSADGTVTTTTQGS